MERGGSVSQTYLDVQHFNVLFPNIVLTALLHCLRNIYRSATSSELRWVDDRVERPTAGPSSYL